MKKNSKEKKKNFSERSRDISVGMEMETLLTKFMGQRMRRLNKQHGDGVLRDRHDELMTQYGPSGVINKGNC